MVMQNLVLWEGFHAIESFTFNSHRGLSLSMDTLCRKCWRSNPLPNPSSQDPDNRTYVSSRFSFSSILFIEFVCFQEEVFMHLHTISIGNLVGEVSRIYRENAKRCYIELYVLNYRETLLPTLQNLPPYHHCLIGNLKCTAKIIQ